MPYPPKRQWLALILCCVALVAPVAAQSGAANGDFVILLTNDDGYDAPGLRALAQALQAVGTVYVAAPATNQSGKGHSIVTSDPITVFERKQPSGLSWFAMEATPATCARMAIESLLPRKPDIVISGINRGENLGIAVYYSGTVGAAREAVLAGYPAIAVSLDGNSDRDYAATAALTRDLVQQLRESGMLKPGLFLNVNAPPGETKGVRITRLSLTANEQIYERRTSPRGRVYYWSDYRPLKDDAEGTDVWAHVRGFITVTPLALDSTDTGRMDAFRKLEKRAAAAAP
jgi:5'-nucleotidase